MVDAAPSICHRSRVRQIPFIRTVPIAVMFVAVAVTLRLAAQPQAPTPEQVDWLRSLEGGGNGRGPRVVTPAPAGLSVNTNRAQARDFYNSIYNASNNIPIGWTGSLTGTNVGMANATAQGTPGTTSAAFQSAVQLRINYFRAMAGIPASIGFDSNESAMDQQAALMMAANNSLSHTPPTSWLLYTAAGATAAGSSNLAIGLNGPDSITGYIQDPGSTNYFAGHRRWILYPQTQTMATGDVPASNGFSAANATWILDSNFGGTRPATRDTFVAWPAPGYVPYQLVFPRWSFAYPNANFANASVSMTLNGTPIAAAISSTTDSGFGEQTMVWDYNNYDPTVTQSAPKPASDLTYNVKVNGVLINGVSQNFSYSVTLFDPSIPGPGETIASISGNAQAPVTQGSPFSVTLPSYASGLEYRTVTLASPTILFSATSGLQGIVVSESGGYAAVVSGVNSASGSAYHLASPDVSDQTLTLPGEYYFPSGSASLQFKSELGFSTTDQTAHAQISLDDGNSWSDLYTQSGAGINSQGETAFVTHTIALDAYAGRTFQIRFAYTFNPGGTSYDPGTTAGNGWFVDSISMPTVMTASVGAASAPQAGTSFSYAPAAQGSFTLQARGLFFGTYPMAWGTLFTGVGTSGDRVTNVSSRVQVGTGGNVLIAGFAIGGSGGSGKQVLIRGDGPTLATFGVTGVLAQPVLSVYDSNNNLVAANTGWSTNANAGQIAAAAASTGAFALASGSADSALLLTLPPGAFTAQVSGLNGTTGVGLAEVYEVSNSDAYPVVNVSSRAQVGTGASILIAGFVVQGTQSATLLVRGVGPTLSTFGVTGVLAQPVLSVLNSSGTVVASNTGWSTNPNAAQIAAATNGYTFALPANSADSALLLTLPPGSYTAQISGANGTTGVALAEVYKIQ